MDLYRYSHSLVSALPVELTYRIGILGLRLPVWRLMPAAYDRRLCIELGQLKLPTPVIAAGGLDKNCSYPKNLLALGFGGVVAGTVTATPQSGNPPPRFVRLPEQDALLNAMGFPNKGINYVVSKLKRQTDLDYLILSISGKSVAEVAAVYQKTTALNLPVEINISSPNTQSLADFQDPARLAELLSALIEINRNGNPLFVKLPRRETELVVQLARVAADQQVSGIVISNSQPTENSMLSTGFGGLSGQPIFKSTTELIEATASELGQAVPLVACGGISSAQDVWQALRLGATAVQLYTALVYNGPRFIAKLNQQLVRALDAAQLSSISEVTKQKIDWPGARG